MGRFDAFEVTHEVTGIDLELIDYATSLAGLTIDQLGVAGKRVGHGFLRPCRRSLADSRTGTPFVSTPHR